jgi:hypothetical protein
LRQSATRAISMFMQQCSCQEMAHVKQWHMSRMAAHKYIGFNYVWNSVFLICQEADRH